MIPPVEVRRVRPCGYGDTDPDFCAFRKCYCPNANSNSWKKRENYKEISGFDGRPVTFSYDEFLIQLDERGKDEFFSSSDAKEIYCEFHHTNSELLHIIAMKLPSSLQR